MKKLNFLFLLLTLGLCSGLQAQNSGPYLEELYDVSVQQDVIYGVNATILPVLFGQTNEAVPRPLNCDVYTPVGDNNDARPLMLVMHTGNFLPFPQNNGTGGTIRDSTVVEVCTRLAARGYVAAAIDYRLGWNPLDESQDVRKFLLINAAYRGVQDCRTAVRYFRLTAQDGGNPFGIDPEKIGTWGIGTGGYIAAAVATLDEYQEVVIPKFLITLGGNTFPMVIEGVNGDVNGTSVGIVPPGYPLPVPEGDTLCYPNHVTYADGSAIPSEIAFTVNNGGALGDISWLDENVAPWVSFHVPSDPFAPYMDGILTVPGTGPDPIDPGDDFPVVEVSGSFSIQAQMNALGFNDAFDNISDAVVDYSDVADARNEGNEGLFPFPNDYEANSSAPWDFYSDDNPNVLNGVNPEADPVRARTYWDTIFAYTAPRACIALDLDCANITGVDELVNEQVGMTVAPNPAVGEIRITSNENSPILAVELYDINGRLVNNLTQVNSTAHTLRRGDLASGVYFLKVHFEAGVGVEKIMFK